MEELVKEQGKENSKPPAPTPAEQKEKENRQTRRDDKIETALAKHPKSSQAQEAGSRYFMERGDNSRAEALTERGLALARPDGDPKLTARLLVTRGLLRYSRHDYRGANLDGNHALKFDPGNWAAWELAMYSLDKWPNEKRPPAAAPGAQSEDDAAERDRVSRLMALQTPGIPRTPEEWVARQKKAPSPAYESLTRSMESRTKGDLPGALALAEAAIRADPTDPMTFAQRALILSQLGDSSGAVLDLSRVIAKGWNWPLAFRMRADALFKAGKWRAALEDAEVALRLDPADADAYFIRAMARSKLGGAVELVLADLERATDLKPAFAPFRDRARERIRK